MKEERFIHRDTRSTEGEGGEGEGVRGRGGEGRGYQI